MNGFEIVVGASERLAGFAGGGSAESQRRDGEGSASSSSSSTEGSRLSVARLVAPLPQIGVSRAKVLPRKADGRSAADVQNEARTDSKPQRQALDIFVGGVNVTARVGADQACSVLVDLGRALLELASNSRQRAVVRFYESPWEIGLRRVDAEHIVLNVVRSGEQLEVAVFERRVRLKDALEGTLAGLRRPEFQGDPAAQTVAQLLETFPASSISTVLPPRDVAAIVEIEESMPIAFAAEMAVQSGTTEALRGVETTDLHALLGRGRLRVGVRGRVRDLGEVHVFLAAERMLSLATDVLDAWERGRPLHSRSPLETLTGPMVGLRLDDQGVLDLTLTSGSPERAHTTFPSLAAPDFVDAVVSFGRALSRSIVRRDRAQVENLRLMSLRRRVREVGERLRDVARPVGPFGESDLVNPRRESYRAYVDAEGRKAAAGAPKRLKFAPRWTAEVPGLDLRGSFLCGDRIILGGLGETACLDREHGQTLWKVPTTRATSLPTPGGLARLRGDGRLELRDFGNGEVVWSVPCAARTRGTPAACTVVAPGLPRLLVATDGDRHLVGFDLSGGQARWRIALPRPGSIRLRRAGRLLVVSSHESQLVAFDMIDGNVVWRVRDRLRFSAPVGIDREDLFAVAGEPGGLCRVHGIDALSGARRWERPLEHAVAGDLAPIVSESVVLIMTRDRRGIGITALDRRSGTQIWSLPPGSFPTGTTALGVDNLLVLNGPLGETCAIHAQNGETVWRAVFQTPQHGDSPRRLEPVLRAGALFVPQDRVRVLRPSDGAVLGVVEGCDLVPDMLRVDERCSVYIAEESGHVAAFAATAAGPQLSLVR